MLYFYKPSKHHYLYNQGIKSSVLSGPKKYDGTLFPPSEEQLLG